jgi:hypothetical protein
VDLLQRYFAAFAHDAAVLFLYLRMMPLNIVSPGIIFVDLKCGSGILSRLLCSF